MVSNHHAKQRLERALRLTPILIILLLGPAVRGEDSGPTLQWAPRVEFEKIQVTDRTGFVPPAFPTDHIAGAVAQGLDPAKVLPINHDCRALGLVSPVKNQGGCGSCYAFGSAADLESRLLAGGDALLDLSENSIKECNFQDTSCAGGNQYVTMNYLSWNGAPLESCDPYVDRDVVCTSGCVAQVAVLEWRSVSGSTLPDPPALKQYLLDFGPLQTTVYAGDTAEPVWAAEFQNYDGSGVLYNPSDQAPNHSVLLVGWDDDLVHAGGSGAWIVKNSWGTNWGGTCGFGSEGGYFTIAYGSAGIGKFSSCVGSYLVAPADAPVTGLDEGGLTSALGMGGPTLWGLASLTVPQGGYLHQVEFWTTDVITDCDVYVYETFNGGLPTGLLASSLDHSFAEPGYRRVVLAEPLSVSAGQEVHVAVKFTNLSFGYPLAVDVDGPKDIGQSWYSFNGTSWNNMDTQGADVTIRIRTSGDPVLLTGGVDPPDDPDIDPQRSEQVPRFQVQGAFPNPFNPSTRLDYSLAQTGQVVVQILDLKGQRVRTLVDEIQGDGLQTVTWDGTDGSGQRVPSGVYFALVAAEEEYRVVKLALLK